MATALERLIQRQQEDWIRVWDHQGKLRPAINAQSITAAALLARDWLIEQDWSGCDRVQPSSQPRSASVPQSHPQQAAALASSPYPPEPSLAQPVILLTVSDPARFLAWFSAITSLSYPLFLADPDWGLSHWHQIESGLAPQLVIADPEWEIPSGLNWCPWLQGELPGEKPSQGNRPPNGLSTEAVANSHKMQSFPQLLRGCGKLANPMTKLGLNDPQPVQGSAMPVESFWIGIPTGGSSGQLRFALHCWDSLTASVVGLQQSDITDKTGQINSCCTLPLHHVSGLMQFVRSLLSDGTFWLLPWPVLKRHFNLSKNSSIGNEEEIVTHNQSFAPGLDQFFVSLVPSQLQALLQCPKGPQWLASFYTVLLGGAPAWPALLDLARDHSIRLAPTYGMTETASQIVTLHPDDFLRGQTGCGKLLPHAQIEWLSDSVKDCDRQPREQKSSPTATESSGILVVRAQSLALGYYAIKPLKTLNEPGSSGPLSSPRHSAASYDGSIELWSGPGGIAATRRFVTDDLAHRNAENFFHIIGRASDKIISGGENVFPASVEAAILATGRVTDAVVLGIADAKWGERVVAVVVPAISIAETVTEQLTVELSEQIAEAIAPALTPAQRPKQWRFIQAIPRSAQGKVQRQQLQDWFTAAERSGRMVGG